MMTLRDARRQTQEIADQRPTPVDSAREASKAALLEVEAHITPMSRVEKIEWLKGELAELEDRPDRAALAGLVADWIVFLELQGADTHGSYDPATRTFSDTPNSQRWHRLEERWGWPASWTGWGLPPQLAFWR